MKTILPKFIYAFILVIFIACGGDVGSLTGDKNKGGNNPTNNLPKTNNAENNNTVEKKKKDDSKKKETSDICQVSVLPGQLCPKT